MGRSWLVLREPERRRIRVAATVLAMLLLGSVVWDVVTRHEVGGQFVGACFLLWMVLELRVGTRSDDEGLTVRAELGARRLRWADLKAVETDQPARWATGVLARCQDGSTVRLRGVRPGEVGEVQEAWGQAVST